MNLKRCDKGHYYDGDKYHECPHCKVSDGSDTVTVPTGEIFADETIPVNTVPVTDVKSNPEGFGFIQDLSEDDDKTKQLDFKAFPVQPVVGWLVCVEGTVRGTSFTLKAGKNFVGRNEIDNDIVLRGDKAVSRDKHAIVIYDPHSNSFLVQAGASRELFYLNDKLVLSAESLVPYDIITLGGTKLIFIPLCGDKFTWETYKDVEKSNPYSGSDSI